MPIWNCRCSALGPKETLVTSIQMTRPATESVQRRKLAALVSWHDQLTTVGWPQWLHWRLETSDVHMQGVAMMQPWAKNSLADRTIWSYYVQSIPAGVVHSSADVYASMAAGVKVQLTSQLCSEIHRCKSSQWQRNTTENTRNLHATNIFEQRQKRRETSYRRKSTVDGKQLVI